MIKNISKTLLVLILLPLFSECGIYKKVDMRERPATPEERRRQNIEEGRGIGLGSLRRSGKTTYEFSSSNPMWRASLETLDILPLTTVDYSGGTIITDWYSENNSNANNESVKITIRFLSNEIRSDSLKIIVHKKKCKQVTNCTTSLLPNNSKLSSELRSVILNKASKIQKASKNKKKKK